MYSALGPHRRVFAHRTDHHAVTRTAFGGLDRYVSIWGSGEWRAKADFYKRYARCEEVEIYGQLLALLLVDPSLTCIKTVNGAGYNQTYTTACVHRTANYMLDGVSMQQRYWRDTSIRTYTIMRAVNIAYQAGCVQARLTRGPAQLDF